MSHYVDEGPTYEVRVQGQLDESWSDWFNGATVACEDEPGGPGSTILIARLDQAALRGLLNRLWDLNLTVESVASLAGPPDPRPAGMSMSPHQKPAAGTGDDPGDVQSEQSVADPDHSDPRSASLRSLALTHHADPYDHVEVTLQRPRRR